VLPSQDELSRLDDTELPYSRQGALVDPVESQTECQEPREIRSPGRRIWRLDYEI